MADLRYSGSPTTTFGDKFYLACWPDWACHCCGFRRAVLRVIRLRRTSAGFSKKVLPRRSRRNAEIRNTNTPKAYAKAHRNSKQIQNSNVRMFKTNLAAKRHKVCSWFVVNVKMGNLLGIIGSSMLQYNKFDRYYTILYVMCQVKNDRRFLRFYKD